MRIVKPITLRSYYKKHRDAEGPLKAWLLIAQKARWTDLTDVRRTFRTADSCKVYSESVVTIFDIKGNAYRLITSIHYNAQVIYIRDFLTHAEYNDMNWKKRH